MDELERLDAEMAELLKRLNALRERQQELKEQQWEADASRKLQSEDFFATPPAPPRSEGGKVVLGVSHSGPAWASPPAQVLPGVVPFQLVLGRSERAVVLVLGLLAYPTGLSFQVASRIGPEGEQDKQLIESLERLDFHFRAWEGELPDELLRFGIEYPDGTRLTNLDRFTRFGPPRSKQPDRPSLVWRGGSDSGSVYSDNDYWLQPLPVAGPLLFVCEWPALGIPLTRRAVDAAAIRQAAEQALVLPWAEASRSVDAAELP